MTTHPIKPSDNEPAQDDAARQGFDGGDGGGYDGPMDKRVTRLELFAAEARARFDRIDARFDQVDTRFDKVDARLDKVDARLDEVDAQLANVELGLERVETRLEFTATKADLERVQNTLIKWFVGALIAVLMAGITIMTFVLNYAAPPRVAMATPAPPVVIYLPAPPAPPTAR